VGRLRKPHQQGAVRQTHLLAGTGGVAEAGVTFSSLSKAVYAGQGNND